MDIPRRRWMTATLVALSLLACACSDEAGEAGVSSLMDVSDGAAFFANPFPMAHRAREDGSLRVLDFPVLNDNASMQQLLALLEGGSSGFSLNGGIMIPFDGPIDETRLPADVAASLDGTATVLLINLDEDPDKFGKLVPIEVSFKAAAETYSPANLLVAVPFQGVVLEPRTPYALVVKRGLGDTSGRPLFASRALQALLAGAPLTSEHGELLKEAFGPLRSWLAAAHTQPSEIAGATVFTTGDPTAEMVAFQEQLSALPPPTLGQLANEADYDGYCVLRGPTTLPVFQRGPKPYAESDSGQLVVDDDGRLVEQERDSLDLILTIPHTTMPDEGFPLVIYAAGAEGKARQVVDRTAIDADPDTGSGPPGQGPAKFYAARGIATLGFNAPLSWDRHPDGTGGLLDFWNVANLGAFRDNIRQGILDITTLVQLMKQLTADASLCAPASTTGASFRYDPAQLFIHGHSTGSTIASASIALEPELRAAVLSGAGGSWIYNLTLAEAPLDMKTVAGELFDYNHPDTVDAFDPAVTLFQTAFESVEVMDWGRATMQHPIAPRLPKQVLLIEGVVDSYHPPRTVNAYAMSVGLDIVAPTVEETAVEDYALVGRELLAAPARGNVLHSSTGPLTGVTVQGQQNAQDGHFVAFEIDSLKHQYSCFLASIVDANVGTLPAANDDALAACP
jgi:hypothetical protein